MATIWSNVATAGWCRRRAGDQLGFTAVPQISRCFRRVDDVIEHACEVVDNVPAKWAARVGFGALGG